MVTRAENLFIEPFSTGGENRVNFFVRPDDSRTTNKLSSIPLSAAISVRIRYLAKTGIALLFVSFSWRPTGNPVAPLFSADSLLVLPDLVAQYSGHTRIQPRLKPWLSAFGVKVSRLNNGKMNRNWLPFRRCWFIAKRVLPRTG